MIRYTTVRPVAIACLALLALLPAAVADVDCGKVNVSPVADFEYAVSPSESAPIMVNFFSSSQGGRIGTGPVSDPIESYRWNFGDGFFSEEESPMHTYAPGSARYAEEDKPFPVTLVLTTGCGRMAAVTKNVSVYCLNHTAGFAITRPEGEGPYTAPVALYVRDTSLHAADWVTTWHYTVWDAGMTSLYLESTEKDPLFIIRNGGSYVIRQETFKACSHPGSRNAVVTKTIEVTGSASSEMIPMETIPFTTAITMSPPATSQAGTPVPAATLSLATTPVPATTGVSPGTGTLAVNSSPAGARVYVNDVLLGSTPVTVPGLRAGQYNLLLEKAGYRNETARVEIGEGKLTEYSAVLAPQSSGTADSLPVVPILAAVIVLAACGFAAAWYIRRKKKPPAQRAPPDGNALFLVEELGT